MEEYYYKKLLQAICFADNAKVYLNNGVLNPTFLKVTKEFLIECNEGSLINYNMKDNLLDLTDYLRYNGYPELANDFIILINQSDIGYFGWYEFICNEFEKRKVSRNEKMDIYDDYVMRDLFQSLEMDFTTLKSLLCDDETYEREFIQTLMLDEFYFISCRKIFEEVPQLLKNEKICERMVIIHLCNKEMKKEINPVQKRDYNRIIKIGKKLVKKVIK